MKDIDFEELDKAVNSLMATSAETGIPLESAKTPTEQTSPVAPESAAPVASEAPTAAEAPVTPPPVVDTTPEAAPAVASVAPPAKPPLATKRSGRFMDVVHPSSDMRTSDKPVAPSRTGVTVQPSNPTVVAETPDVDTVDTTKSQVQALVPNEVEPTTDGVASGVMPDPLDMSNTQQAAEESSAPDADLPSDLDSIMAEELQKNTEAITDTDKAEVAETTPVSTAPEPGGESTQEPALATDADELLGSPFLPDAKVEKRPLGGIASESTDLAAEEPTVTTEEDVSKTDEASIETPIEPVEADLPPELHPNVAAIEATLPSQEPAAPASTTMPDTETTAPVSIPQQYREKVPTDTSQHEALYDSAAQGTPLAHPAKKSSGWLWVLVSVLLIALGAGGAAALYYFKLI